MGATSSFTVALACHGLRRVEGIVDAVAPDIVREVREVDERIAVALNLIHGVVSLHLQLAYGVELSPLYVKLRSPFLQGGVVALLQRDESLLSRPLIVLVCRSHIHVGT